MIIKKIKIKNIRSYREAEVEFPLGAVLLAGDIGSGKTTILLAIEYALFGLQPGQRGSSILTNGEEYGEVALELDVSGDKVCIERGLRRGSKSINQDFAAITINGSRFESSVSEVKTKILEILNYPQEFLRKNNILYRYTIYTPQESMKQIILEDPESRLDVLRNIFGLDKYKRIKENLQKTTAKLREDSRILQIEVVALDTKKNEIENSIKFMKIISEKISVKEQEIKAIVESRQIHEKEIESLNKLLEEREKFKKEIEKSNIVLANKKEYLANIQEEINEIKSLLTAVEITYNEKKLSEIENDIIKTLNTVEILEKTIIDVISKRKSLDLLKNQELDNINRVFKIDFCPTCLQDVSEAHKHNILNAKESEISKINLESSSLDIEISRIKNEQEKQKNNLRNLESEKAAMQIQKVRQENIKKHKEKLQEILKTKEITEKDITFLENHIISLKESSLEYAKFENILKVKKEEMRKILEFEKASEIEVAELKKERELCQKDIFKLQQEIVKAEQAKQKLVDLLECEAWLSNNLMNLVNFIEKNMLAALRKEFTKIFNKWFSMLTTDAFEVYLDETFSPVIVHSEFELDYEFLSGGERTAVALAYRLALNQLINSVLSKIKTQDIVILDEPTDGFSEQQLDKVRDILHELHIKQLIIVSHESKIEGFVDHIIKVKKENGKSIVA